MFAETIRTTAVQLPLLAFAYMRTVGLSCLPPLTEEPQACTAANGLLHIYLEELAYRGEVSARVELQLWVFRQRNADGVSEAIHEQSSNTNGAFHPPIFSFAGFRNSKVQRVVPPSPGVAE